MTTLLSSEALPAIPSTIVNLPEITPQDLLALATRPASSDLSLVESRLRTLLQSRVAGVPEIMAYLIQAGGKRVRPLLTCLTARACGYEGTDHVIVACVSELLHTATLYHDDVVDHASTRRGKATANHVFGNKITVLAGDLMLAQCFSLLMDGGHFSISRALSRTVKQMVEGEILQLQLEENYDAGLDNYLSVIENKTASLFSWACQAAGMVSGASPQKARLLARFGFHTGMAFQLVDDLMDFCGDMKSTGKDALNDLREGKITLPLLLVLKHYPQFKDELRQESSGRGRDAVFAGIQERVRQPHIQGELRAMIVSEINQARQMLSAFPSSVYRTGMISLLQYLENRDR